MTCPHCDDGWRHVAVHYTPPSGRERVRTFLAACDCAKGARVGAAKLDHGRIATHTEFVAKWRGYRATVHVTNATQPHLTREQTLPADRVAALEAGVVDENPYQAIAEAACDGDE